MQAVAYYRVSTKRQGDSGLGLDAQRTAVARLVSDSGWKVAGEYVEVESGKKHENRPRLMEALTRVRLTGGRLVIAKLDRLSRNAAFLLTLRDSGVQFVCADMPHANPLTVGVMALVAQDERERISTRTREALAQAKARGVKLGCPLGASHLKGRGNAEAIQAVREQCQAMTNDLGPIVRGLMEEGVTSLRAIATQLNERGFLTPRRTSWHASTVRRLLGRMQEVSQSE